MVVDKAALRQLENGFRGRVVDRAHAEFDEHRRIWNGSIDRRPALIARCAGAADVVAAVEFGRRTGLEVAVRSGGHSFPGMSVCDDGLTIDQLLSVDIVTADGQVVTASREQHPELFWGMRGARHACVRPTATRSSTA